MANTARLNDVVIVTPGFSAARVTEAGQDIVTIDGLLLVFGLVLAGPAQSEGLRGADEGEYYSPWESFLHGINYYEEIMLDQSQLGNLVWKAGFETGNKTEWCLNQSGCGEYNERIHGIS